MGNKQQNKTNILIGGDSPTEKKEPPVFDSTATETMGKLINMIGYVWALLKFYTSTYKMEVGLLMGLLIYVITIIVIYTTNPYELITEKNGGASIFLSLLGGFLIIMAFLFYQKKKNTFENVENAGALSYFGKVFTSMFSIILIIAIVYFLFNMASYYTDFSTYFLFGLNILIVVCLLTIAVKYFGIHGGEPGETKPSWGKLLLKIITYVPCLLLDLTDYIKYQYQLTTKPIVILLLVELVLIGLYFVYPWLMEQILTHNSQQLLKYPVNLNVETNLVTFSDVNFVDDKFQYQYAISSWIYIDSFPPETNSSYDNYTSLLNIGNKPNILFNVAKNNLRIKMETEGKNEKIVYETTEFNMQRWNHIIVNYDGATLDIFINNKLVSSTPGIIPYNDDTMMTSGTTSGIYGGICNVTYYRNAISRGKINWAYNSVKKLNPPVI